MSCDQAGRLLNELGQLLAEDNAYPLDGTLLCAGVDNWWISISIFKDLGDHVLYRDADYDLLQDTLFDLWELDDPGKRWLEIEYVIRDGRFDAAFAYPDEIDPEELMSLDRRDLIVKRYFGDKPIRYPQPEDDEDLFEL